MNGNGKVMSSNHENIHRGIQMMLSEMWECAARSTHHRHERDELRLKFHLWHEREQETALSSLRHEPRIRTQKGKHLVIDAKGSQIIQLSKSCDKDASI